KKNEVELKFKGSDSMPEGLFEHFRIRARINLGKGTILVSTKPALRKAFPLMLNLPAPLEGLFSLGVKAD
ncbi:MAG TPA: hypothetical protein VK633_15175, partial [Verrucomicrobiae bacterium]|nr:hypothetical protein [Verrucomicrobiae bacterium]